MSRHAAAIPPLHRRMRRILHLEPVRRSEAE
jgi:hypothetical protein